MITSLELRNWRAYEHLDLRLGPGATFIVAPNGVGKSSIVEAARFATFGVLPGRGPAHKADATGPTTASVTIDVGNGQTLRITRTLPTKKKADPIVEATRNGGPFAAAELDRFLSAAFGATTAFLDRMSMMAGSEVLGDPKGLDLRSHLSAFLGLGGVENALGQTERLLRLANAEVDRHRNAAKVSSAELDQLRTAAAQASGVKIAKDAAVTAAQAQLRNAREARTVAHRATEAVRRSDERLAQLAALVAEAAALTGIDATADTIDDVLAASEAHLYEQVEQIRRRRAELNGRIDATTAAVDELEGTTGACPVCRRPLDPEDIETAREAHLAEIRSWTDERDALDEGSATEALQRVSGLRAAVLRLGPAPELPEQILSAEETEAAEAAATAALDTAVVAAAEARAASTAAQSALETAESAASALDAVIVAFERQATLEATKEALTKTRGALLAEGIEPLEEALREQWTNLYERRTGLTLAGDGTVARTIGKDKLTFTQFSDGERMAAQLLLRVLVLKATTTLPFLWIDEPLEHLDPDARRALSLLLARAPKEGGGPLRQVVMTTYEEPLVRRLQSALAGTHVTYVLAGGT